MRICIRYRYYDIDVCFINISMHVALFVSGCFLLVMFFASFFRYLGQVSMQESLKRWMFQILHMTSIPQDLLSFEVVTLDAGHSPSMMLKGSHDLPMKSILTEGMSSIPTQLQYLEDQHETERIRRTQAEEG